MLSVISHIKYKLLKTEIIILRYALISYRDILVQKIKAKNVILNQYFLPFLEDLNETYMIK